MVRHIALMPVWREAEALFSTTEQAALARAESLTRVADTGAPNADYGATAAVFAPKALTDLTIAIGLMNIYNRLGIGFHAVAAAALAANAA